MNGLQTSDYKHKSAAISIALTQCERRVTVRFVSIGSPIVRCRLSTHLASDHQLLIEVCERSRKGNLPRVSAAVIGPLKHRETKQL